MKVHKSHTCCTVCFYPLSKETKQHNYTNENRARNLKDKYTLGIWKIKKS